MWCKGPLNESFCRDKGRQQSPSRIWGPAGPWVEFLGWNMITWNVSLWNESQTTAHWFFFLIESISFSLINWLVFPMQTTLIIHHDICVFLISHKSYMWDGSFLLAFDKALF